MASDTLKDEVDKLAIEERDLVRLIQETENSILTKQKYVSEASGLKHNIDVLANKISQLKASLRVSQMKLKEIDARAETLNIDEMNKEYEDVQKEEAKLRQEVTSVEREIEVNRRDNELRNVLDRRISAQKLKNAQLKTRLDNATKIKAQMEENEHN